MILERKDGIDCDQNLLTIFPYPRTFSAIVARNETNRIELMQFISIPKVSSFISRFLADSFSFRNYLFALSILKSKPFQRQLCQLRQNPEASM
jgi:hypothetical protein